jgi:acyl phosphate:glycerol-3-phosphate acyltransferase
LAYLLGTFPSAVMVARSRGVDILSQGSGNPGASNVARVLGSRWGALVFLLDALKGAVPAAVGLALDSRPAAYVLVSAAVLGHMFPITRQFRGGKGVATMAGAMVVLHPLTSVVLTAVWFITRAATHKASLASLAITLGLPICLAVAGVPAWEFVAVIALCLLVLVRHIDNIKRLIARRELSANSS